MRITGSASISFSISSKSFSSTVASVVDVLVWDGRAGGVVFVEGAAVVVFSGSGSVVVVAGRSSSGITVVARGICSRGGRRKVVNTVPIRPSTQLTTGHIDRISFIDNGHGFIDQLEGYFGVQVRKRSDQQLLHGLR